jgi:hypothetical protein
MENSKINIGPMKKVILEIEAGHTLDRMDLICTPISFEFIFGVGVQGLSPFEAALDGKTCGATVFFKIHSREISELLEHLSLPLDEIIHKVPVFYLKAFIDKIAAAEDREIVSAMAGASACGQGDCGCGCGSH